MTEPGPVLVTGTSTGIGRAIVEHLSSNGHAVLAGARTGPDLDALGHLANVTPLEIDVTREEKIQRAFEWVRRSDKGLYGLVNCAGIAGFGPMVDTSVEELHRILDVNLFGAHRMVQRFYPFLIASHGRIVNISSMGGILTETFLGTYGISKHAVEAYTDLLREELAGLGVGVSAIEPGAFRSELGANYVASKGPNFASAWNKSLYRKVIEALIPQYTGTPEALHRLDLPDPAPVAEAVSEALFSDSPKPRYLVAPTKAGADKVMVQVLTLLDQLNRGQTRPLSKAQLARLFEKTIHPVQPSRKRASSRRGR